MKLAVFDFDSTLMEGETLEFIAREYNIEPLMKEITTKAMEGKIDFFESLIQRVALLKGAKEEKIIEICENLPYTKGAKETISELDITQLQSQHKKYWVMMHNLQIFFTLKMEK